MKFALATLLLSTMFSCTQASKPELASVEGMTDFKNQWLYLVQPDPWALKANIADSVKTDASGAYKLSVDVAELTEFMISGRGFFLTTVFLRNGYNLKADILGKGRNKKDPVFSGNGADVNAFWAHMSKRFYQAGGYNDAYKKMVARNEPDGFQKEWQAYIQTQMDVLDSFSKAVKPDKAFRDWAESYIKYSGLAKSYTYLFHKPRFSNTGEKYLKVDDAYYDFLEGTNVKTVPDAIHNAYRDFMYFYLLDFKSRATSVNDPVQASFDHAQNELPAKGANISVAFMIKDLIDNASSRKDYSRLRELMAAYKEWPDAQKYAEFLEYQFNEKASLAPGSPAPDFELKDISGKTVSLSSLKGQVVVIDFWGTWCGPCKRELPFSKKIEEHYADRDDVTFLFVALERGPEAYWKKFVSDNNIPGVHLYSPNSNRALMPYKITSVPRYVIVDKEGKIYDAFASRPSQNMKQQIAKVLEL